MQSDVLILDAQTVKDLEIFGSETGNTCLYEFCNLTRTDGGAKVLRHRMEHPWSSTERITATQESISFILAHREVFAALPTAFSTNRVQHYAEQILPIVDHENSIEFGFGAFSLWANHDTHYMSIARGVQFTSGLIHSLRQFVDQNETKSTAGELSALLEEMRTLLARPKLSNVASLQLSRSFWRVLRLDQVYRLHEKETIRRLLQLIFELDALISMADVTRTHDFVMPYVKEGVLQVEAENLVHPFVNNPVANPVKLDQSGRLLFLTGPNMAGKTTYLRTFATALYFAQLGMGVPASSFSFAPAERLFSSISLTDDLHTGVSYFRAEALRVKAVAEAVAAGYRVVAIMDEPFKGTNVKDAFDASLAIIQRFAAREGCLFMFSSHLIELGEQLSATSQIEYHYFQADEEPRRLGFDYLLRAGVSSQRLGMRVLREEGVFDLLDE